jgi:hypothetical protein
MNWIGVFGGVLFNCITAYKVQVSREGPNRGRFQRRCAVFVFLIPVRDLIVSDWYE